MKSFSLFFIILILLSCNNLAYATQNQQIIINTNIKNKKINSKDLNTKAIDNNSISSYIILYPNKYEQKYFAQHLNQQFYLTAALDDSCEVVQYILTIPKKLISKKIPRDDAYKTLYFQIDSQNIEASVKTIIYPIMFTFKNISLYDITNSLDYSDSSNPYIHLNFQYDENNDTFKGKIPKKNLSKWIKNQINNCQNNSNN